MPPFTSLQPDFTAGELAPSLLARVDFAKYTKGCKLLKNFLVQPHGGAVKRPGFLLLDLLPGEAQLIPFVFNVSQSYCLCFGEGWLRVATAKGFVLGANGLPLHIAGPYTLAQAKTLSHVQSGDVLFLACLGVRPQKLKRLAHEAWEFESVNFTAPIAPPDWKEETTSATKYTYAKAYTSGQAFTRTLAGEDAWGQPLYAYAPVNKILYTESAATVTTTVNKVEFVNGAKKSDGSASTAQLVTPYSYALTCVDAEGKESAAGDAAGFTGPAVNNWQAGDYAVLTWLPVEGAVEYRVYKASFSGTPGYVGTTGTTTWRDYNVSPVSTQTPPKWSNPFPGDDWPSVVGFFEQRLVFASSAKRPQTIWLSRSGDYDNFSASSPLQADDAIELTIAGNEVSRMHWLVSLRSLILGAEGVEWEMGASEGAFTARTAKVTPQSYRGSAPLRALVVGNAVLHVTRSGREVRDLKYDFGSDSYGGADRTILAGHLFEGRTITGWTYQSAPDSIIWVVRDDGVLLGMTFQPEHEVFAWHQHHTKGLFKAACAVAGPGADRLFACVTRASGFCLEVMAPYFYGGETAPCVFLDSALTYSGAAVSHISGLSHLEGQSVGILADGAASAGRMVTGGKITLDTPAKSVTVGLPYTADLETMPVEVMGEGGASVGRKKVINAVNILFRNTVTGSAGISFDRLEHIKWRKNEAHGQALTPYTGTHRVIVPELGRNMAGVCIRSDAPLPMTVLAVMPEVEVK